MKKKSLFGVQKSKIFINPVILIFFALSLFTLKIYISPYNESSCVNHVNILAILTERNSS